MPDDGLTRPRLPATLDRLQPGFFWAKYSSLGLAPEVVDSLNEGIVPDGHEADIRYRLQAARDHLAYAEAGRA